MEKASSSFKSTPSDDIRHSHIVFAFSIYIRIVQDIALIKGDIAIISYDFSDCYSIIFKNILSKGYAYVPLNKTFLLCYGLISCKREITNSVCLVENPRAR